MKIIRLEANYDKVEYYKLSFDNENGVTPKYPKTVNDSGCDIAIGKVGESAGYMHHLDKDDTRYLIYLNGSIGRLNGEELLNLEKALDSFLENSKSKV